MYYYGESVPEDEVEAYKWFLLSEEYRERADIDFLELLEKKLTPSQRAKGQKLAKEFKPKKEWKRLSRG